MNKSLHFAKITKKDLNLMIVISLAITLFLFFIDEGYYNFQWMKNPFTWLIFFIYVTLILVGQLLISFAIPKSLDNTWRKLIYIAAGTLLGLTFLITIVFD